MCSTVVQPGPSTDTMNLSKKRPLPHRRCARHTIRLAAAHAPSRGKQHGDGPGDPSFATPWPRSDRVRGSTDRVVTRAVRDAPSKPSNTSIPRDAKALGSAKRKDRRAARTGCGPGGRGFESRLSPSEESG